MTVVSPDLPGAPGAPVLPCSPCGPGGPGTVLGVGTGTGTGTAVGEGGGLLTTDGLSQALRLTAAASAVNSNENLFISDTPLTCRQEHGSPSSVATVHWRCLASRERPRLKLTRASESAVGADSVPGCQPTPRAAVGVCPTRRPSPRSRPSRGLPSARQPAPRSWPPGRRRSVPETPRRLPCRANGTRA